jgi:hypothetical protein
MAVPPIIGPAPTIDRAVFHATSSDFRVFS